MDAYYETPEGHFLCVEHANQHVQVRNWGSSVTEYNAAAGCDLDGFPHDGSETPDDVYRWTDGEVCQQCE